MEESMPERGQIHLPSNLDLLMKTCDQVRLWPGASGMSADGRVAFLNAGVLSNPDLLDEHAARLLWLRLANDGDRDASAPTRHRGGRVQLPGSR